MMSVFVVVYGGKDEKRVLSVEITAQERWE
jgi:hypothetical protein